MLLKSSLLSLFLIGEKKKKSFQFLKAETIIFGMMFGISMMLLYKQA